MKRYAGTLLALLTLCTGCVMLEKRGYRAPYGLTYSNLYFDAGTLRVSNGDCASVDTEALKGWANRAYADARAIWPRSNLVTRDLYVVGRNLDTSYGLYKKDYPLIEFRCGTERVIRHELFHHWCYQNSLPCDCAKVDHPGYPLGVCA